VEQGSLAEKKWQFWPYTQTNKTCQLVMTIAVEQGSLAEKKWQFWPYTQANKTCHDYSCGTRFLGREKMAVLAVHTSK
jgi:hypothetical protein